MELDTLLVLSGMVLVRTETGQLVMVPQQVLAQAQAKLQQGQAVANIAQRPATPTATTTIRVSTATTVGLQSRQHLGSQRLYPLDFPESRRFPGLKIHSSISQEALLVPYLPTCVCVCVPGSSDCPPGLPLTDQNGSASLYQHCAGEILLNDLFPLFLLEARVDAPCLESITSLAHLEKNASTFTSEQITVVVLVPAGSPVSQT